MDAFVFFFSFTFALIVSCPVFYLLDLYCFKRHLSYYNSNMSEDYQIPIPSSLKDLDREYRKFVRFNKLYLFEVYHYNVYFLKELDTNE